MNISRKINISSSSVQFTGFESLYPVNMNLRASTSVLSSKGISPCKVMQYCR